MSDQPAFQDLSRLATALRTTLGVFAAVAMISVWSGWLEVDLLKRILADEVFTEAEFESNETRQSIVAIVYVLVYWCTAILFLRWTYLSNRNSRALGAERMRYTPGWAVGWYFVPIACLWKPYQALVETFKASHPSSTDEWELAPRPVVLPIWWSLWIVTTYLAAVIVGTTLKAEGVDQTLTSSMLALASDALDIPLALVVIALVAKLQRWQEAKRRRLGSMPLPEAIVP